MIAFRRQTTLESIYLVELVNDLFAPDFDLDPMTLIYKLDLDIMKMYLHIITEVSSSRISKVQAGQTQTQTQVSWDTAIFYNKQSMGCETLLT